MIIDAKNRVQTILDNRGDSMDNELEQEIEEGLSSASEEIIKAIENKDAGGLKESLRAFFEMCEELPHEENEEEESEGNQPAW